MSMAMRSYPVRVEFEGDTHVEWWHPLVHWLLVIPQSIVVGALTAVRFALTLFSFFTVLFTGQIPRPLFDFIAMTYRYEWRVTTYSLFLREDYPPFEFTPDADDHTGDHARLSIEYPEHLNRWMPLVKWFLVIPHLLVLCVLGIGAFFAIIGGFFAVLFTNRYPEGLRDFLVGFYRWNLRVQAYAGLLTDQYPPFSLEA